MEVGQSVQVEYILAAVLGVGAAVQAAVLVDLAVEVLVAVDQVVAGSVLR